MSSLQQWTPTTLGELLIFTGGSQPPLSVFSKTEHEGYIRLIQIRDYKTDKYTTYIPKDLARRFCDADDIMIGRYGPPIFQILRGLEGAYNVALIKVTPKGNILKDFAWHYLRNDRLFKHIDKLSRRTSGQTGVDLNELENYPIQLPPLAEQQKIAQALTDADNYISALEKLIEKKKMMKEGLMVNLLTGKQRLKEFAFNEDGTAKGYKDSELGKIPEDWEIFKLKDLTYSTAGGTPSTLVDAYWGGENPWMSSGELHLKEVFDVSERITDLGLENSSTKYVPKNSVLIGLAGQGKTRGTVAISRIRLCTNQSIAAIFPSPKFNSDYLYYNLDNRYEELRSLSTGDGGRGGLNLSIINNLSVPFPNIDEQNAIVNNLKTIDNELNVLNTKLSKANLLKQGMMQKLLTGEIRLA